MELKKALPETFRDFAPYRDACQFVGCSHTKEKGCAVLRALEEGKIARSRHESYMRLYEELKGLKEWEAKGKKNRKLCKQHRRSGLYGRSGDLVLSLHPASAAS